MRTCLGPDSHTSADNLGQVAQCRVDGSAKLQLRRTTVLWTLVIAVQSEDASVLAMHLIGGRLVAGLRRVFSLSRLHLAAAIS